MTDDHWAIQYACLKVWEQSDKIYVQGARSRRSFALQHYSTTVEDLDTDTLYMSLDICMFVTSLCCNHQPEASLPRQ